MKKTRKSSFVLLTFLDNFLDVVKNIDIKWLTSFPSLIVITVMIIVGNLDIAYSENLNDLLIGFIFLTASLVSVIIIIRKEYPFFRTIKGRPAIFLGVIGFLISFPLAAAIFIRLLLNIFR